MATAGSHRVPVPVLPAPVRPGASRTALASLQAHALAELAGPVGADAPAVRLYAVAAEGGRKHLDAVSDPAAYRAAVRTGILPDQGRLARFRIRKAWMADAADAAIARGVRQIVVLGAGFDTLGVQLLHGDADLVVIEADAHRTLQAKTHALSAAGIPAPWPRFADVDLAEASGLVPAFCAVGGRASEPTLFVAEVVLEYLAPAAALALLTTIGTQMTCGSRLACTVRFGDVEDDYIAASAAAVGEPMRFRPLAADLEPLLTRAGLGVVATRGGVRGRRAASALLVLAPRRPDMSAERAELDAAVDAGLGDVAARLGRGGQWPSRRHERADRTDAGRHEISPCVTALGVLALAGVAHPLVDTIRRRSRAHLAGTMQPPGLWRYYGDFPCDVDTSALAALALGHPFLAEGRYAPALVGARLGDGRFRIWMVPGDPVAGEPDVVANANAVAALGQRPEIDPAVRWITDVVDQGRAAEAAWYYRDELDLALAIQRAVDGGVVALRRSAQASARRAAVRLGRDAATLSPHRLAQAIVAAAWDGFASTDEALARAQALLAAHQRPDGSWPADLFSVGPRPPDPPRFWFVSEAVTTALCVGALTVGAVESRNALR